MINETCQNNAIITFAEITATGFVDLIGEYKFLVIFFAAIGFISLLSAIGEKIFKAISIGFKVFIAIPLIIIVGLINKNERASRLKELGLIRAHLKDYPDKWKIILYRLLIFLFLFIFIIILIYAQNIIMDFVGLSELLANATNTT